MGNVTAKTSGEIASFMTPAETNITSLKVHFSPKQLGEGNPSPENVREIVGWDGVEVNGCGKNIAHIVGYSAKNGEVNAPRYTSNNHGTTINTTDFLLPDTKLVVTQSSYTTEYDPVSYRNGYFAIFVDNLDFEKKYNVSFNVDIINNPLNVDISRIRVLSPLGTGFRPPIMINGNRLFYTNVPFTPYSNGGIQNLNRKHFEIRNCGMSFTLSEFMVTPVDEDNFEYEPYQGNMYSKEWSSDVGTIYGGYVDLISGELTEEWFKHNLQTSVKYTKSSAGYNGWWFTVTTLGNKFQGGVNSTNPSTQLLSNVFTTNTKRGLSNGTNMDYVIKTWGGSTGADTSQFCFSGFSSEDIEDFYSFINQYKPVICYKLAIPITHQLTPTQLQSFIGQNNFWSNADYVEIEYDLIETEDIQKCRKKIMLNQPHTESVIGDVANFTTNIKAPLKECKVYFNPIQEGSGDPSPDNVRNIIGWNGVEVNGCGKNLLNISDSEALVYKNYNNFIINKDKSITITKGSFVLFPVPVKSNTTYLYNLTASSNTNHFMMRVQEYSEKPTNINTGNWLVNSGIGNKSSFSFTTNANTTWLLVGFYNNDAYTSDGNQIINNLQLELGSTTTSYEPYQGTTTSVSWSNEVGTIYGGYVDLAKGELVATQVGVRKKLSEANYKRQNSNGVYQYNFNFAIPYGQILNKYGSQKCNVCGYSWNMSDFKQNHFFGYYNESMGNRFLLFLLEDHGLSDDAEIDFMSELTSPVTFQLTPQQLLTFKGENNIWSDTNGQTEVKFWTH